MIKFWERISMWHQNLKTSHCIFPFYQSQYNFLLPEYEWSDLKTFPNKINNVISFMKLFIVIFTFRIGTQIIHRYKTKKEPICFSYFIVHKIFNQKVFFTF